MTLLVETNPLTRTRDLLFAGIIIAGIVLCLSFTTASAFDTTTEQSATTTCQRNDSTGNKATVGVYYESRCPDSKRFVLNQLLPTYREIGDIFKTNLVAFGHARIVSSSRMICQHGQRECEGNRLMACISTYGKSEGDILETIGCLFQDKLSAKECVEKHLPGIPYDRIEKCKNSDESFKLMVKDEKLTGRLSYVPHLTYNGESSQDIQNELEFNLKSYLCQQHQGPKPAKCAESTTDEPKD